MLNEAHTTADATYYNRDRPSILEMVRPGPNVILDLGCGAGAVGRRLIELGKASEIIGVELFPVAASKAAEHYSEVHTGDIESMDLPYGPQFDYVLCGDILEHLKDPYTIVSRIRGWLKEDGRFICSVPNVRYGRVVAGLLFLGAWEYRDAGVMDRTHLRFFTRRSCLEMLHDGGFIEERVRLLITGRKFRLLNALTLGLFTEFIAPQIVVLSRKQSTTRSGAPV